MGEVKGCVGVYSVEKFVTKRERESVAVNVREREWRVSVRLRVRL